MIRDNITTTLSLGGVAVLWLIEHVVYTADGAPLLCSFLFHEVVILIRRHIKSLLKVITPAFMTLNERNQI